MADNKSCEGKGLKAKADYLQEVFGTDDASNPKLSVKMDISDAIKGLKAIQREAKKATAALKELEEQKKKNMSLPTGGFKPHTIVFDEFNITCPNCGGTNVQSTEKATGCNDCGWHDA